MKVMVGTTLENINPEKIALLEKALSSINPSDASRVLLAVDGLFEEIEGDAICAKQAASYPGFNPQMHRTATESTYVVAERIFNLRDYLQHKAREPPHSPAK